MAFVKVYNAPLQSQRPIGGQIQALTLSLGGDSNGEDGVRSFFTQLQQLTRHLYAPVVRAAGQSIEVCFIHVLTMAIHVSDTAVHAAAFFSRLGPIIFYDFQL